MKNVTLTKAAAALTMATGVGCVAAGAVETIMTLLRVLLQT